jgi:hypothetical protein
MLAAEDTTAPVQDDEVARVQDWRIDRFIELGFTYRQARRLAEKQADWHSAETLLKHGCPLDLVRHLLS